eukprot:941222-Amphidinium_carterae.3
MASTVKISSVPSYNTPAKPRCRQAHLSRSSDQGTVHSNVRGSCALNWVLAWSLGCERPKSHLRMRNV